MAFKYLYIKRKLRSSDSHLISSAFSLLLCSKKSYYDCYRFVIIIMYTKYHLKQTNKQTANNWQEKMDHPCRVHLGGGGGTGGHCPPPPPALGNLVVWAVGDPIYPPKYSIFNFCLPLKNFLNESLG